jgi:hypothetical protein
VSNPPSIRFARNPVLATLSLIAFCAQALVPVGFMPGAGGLVICPGHLPAVAASTDRDTPAMAMVGTDMPGMDMAVQADRTSAGKRPTHYERQTLCPFASAATAMAAMAPSAPALAYIYNGTFLQTFPRDRWIHRRAIAPNRLPRGPPSLNA